MSMNILQRVLVLILLNCFLHFFNVSSQENRSANISTVWINNSSIPKGNISFSDGSIIRPILLVDSESTQGSGFGFGFFRKGNDSSFIIVVVYLSTNLSSTNSTPIIIWSANRDQPVRENARLEFSAEGDLSLSDSDGSFVWSSNTSGLNVTSMNLTSYGNLQLRNGSDFGVVWQSFHYPTNTWFWSQTLHIGQNLTASVSASDYSSGRYYVSVRDDGVFAFLDSDPPVMYRTLFLFSSVNESLNFVIRNFNGVPTKVTYSPSSTQYVRLEPDGHLNVYELFSSPEPMLISNLLKDDRFVDCGDATVCGNYGICTDGQCSCPAETGGNNMSYFREVNATQPNLGCVEVTPLSCNHTQLHTFLQLENVTTFDFVPSLSNIDIESCKKACLSNCSCKTALFQYQNNVSSGNCSLPLQLFSLMASKKEVVGFNSFAFVKVQKSVDTDTGGNTSSISLIVKILVPCLSALVVFVVGVCYCRRLKRKIVKMLVPCLSALVVFVVGVCYCCRLKRKTSYAETKGKGEEDDESSDNVSGMLTKFSFEDLRSAMQRVERRLGGGGFGSVHEGVLKDGTRVAVKILESVHQGKKEFMAELNTIGSIHHVNLVRLIGYCTEGSNKLLVYEHMYNGSLDKWIFDQNRAQTLNWEVRRNIIVGIAKGLEYLHELCNHHIIHFDIKPQNILLDENFNVKISDFGLAKLIDRNQSQVLTRLKGTPGYAAPELIRGRNVSVKADIYSFGIVILEIVCGRRNLGSPQEDYLIDVVKIKAEEDQLPDLVDDRNQDMQFHRGEAVKMMEIAIRCLQAHFRRPSASMVVKLLEGLMDMEPIGDYSFLTMINIGNSSEARPAVSAPPMSSILSGPR